MQQTLFAEVTHIAGLPPDYAEDFGVAPLTLHTPSVTLIVHGVLSTLDLKKIWYAIRGIEENMYIYDHNINYGWIIQEGSVQYGPTHTWKFHLSFYAVRRSVFFSDNVKVDTAIEKLNMKLNKIAEAINARGDFHATIL